MDNRATELRRELLRRELAEREGQQSQSQSSSNPLGNWPFERPSQMSKEDILKAANMSDKDLQQMAMASIPLGGNIAGALKGIQSLPIVGSLLRGGENLLEKGGTIPKKIASYLGTSGEGGLVGAAANPEDRQQGTIGGALLAPALRGTIEGIPQAINALRPSVMFRGNLTPEQLERNLRATQGTETGLGDVIGSPILKKQLENTLTAIPGTGANEAYQRIGKQVTSRGENLLAGLLGHNNPENIPEQLHTMLNTAFKKHEAQKTGLYTHVNDLADKENLKLELPSFAKKANAYSDAIATTNILKFEPDVAKLFNKLQNYKNPIREEKNVGMILDKEGNPLINETESIAPSLKEANLLKGKLGHYAKTFKASPDPDKRGLAKVFGSLAASLKNDINSSIENSGSEKLKKAYDTAEENYGKNFSKFLDKDIYKFIGGNAPPEALLDKMISTTKSSKSAGEKLRNILGTSESSNKLATYAYLSSRALDNEGNLNPSKLATAIDKLGKSQFKALVPNEEERQNLLDFSKLSKMNKEAQYLMFNPKTGQRSLSMTTPILAHGISALIGGAGAGLPGALAGAAFPMIGGNIATKLLTSEKVRNALVKKMLENSKKTPKNRINFNQSLAQHQAEGNQGY